MLSETNGYNYAVDFLGISCCGVKKGGKMKLLRTEVILFVALLVTLLFVPIAGAAGDELHAAPTNPEFIRYVKEKPYDSQVQDGTHGLGLMPSPIYRPDVRDIQMFGSNAGDRSTSYPATYDLRTSGKVSPVKDQNPFGTCWAFATYGSLESTLMPATPTPDFSEKNLANLAGFDIPPSPQNGGGDMWMSAAYLTRWNGPVDSATEPYPTTSTWTSSDTYPPVKHVQNVVFFPARTNWTDTDNIKGALTRWGAVYSSFYWGNAFYNATHTSYYQPASASDPPSPLGGGHAVTIAGWDDNYEATNFTTTPAGPGAWIVKNSWGATWGDNGYFYMSYYDKYFGSALQSSTSSGDAVAPYGPDAVKEFSTAVFLGESTSNYDTVYSYDKLGEVKDYSYGTNKTGSFANVFTANSSETIKAVGFYTTDLNVSTTISIYKNPTSGPVGGTPAATFSETLPYMGYNTVVIPSSQQVPVTTGDKFSVVVQVTNPTNDYYIPIEENLEEYTRGIVSQSGQGYLLGTSGWADLKTTVDNSHVCVKAYTSSTTLPPDLVITQPSANETQFAEMRDFYVYGKFSPTAANPGDFRIELYPESACTGEICTGLALRSIQSHVDPVSGVTNASQIDWSFVNGKTVSGGYVPDIIKEPGGYTDPNNKVVVTYSYYAGLILGGVTKNYNTTYKNSSGYPLQDLTAGDYKIKVTGLSGDFAARCVTKSITFGITNTALGTNRPTNNKNVRVSYAIGHGLRTYFDSFPGYFSDGGSNWSSFLNLSAPNNGIEVVNDLTGTMIDTVTVANNTMFVYNINSASTTYSVELAPILKYNLADSANTTFLYYANGEPVLTYNDSSGAPQQVTSALKQFSGSSRIALTHLDVRNPNGTSYENLFDPNDTTWKWVYTDLSGTISINQGQSFTIYGVTKPIPSTVSSTSTPYWYAIDNRTSQLVCNITDTYGNLVSTSTHEVNLSRYFNNYPGSRNPYQKFNSLFEFGSEFTTLTLPGTYTVTLTGTDISGTVVTGTSSTVNVTVLPVADNVGVFRGGVFYRNGATDIVYGLPTDTPVIGDWNGDGISESGVFRDSVFYRNGATDIVYGLSTDTPVIGDWNGDHISEVGVYRDGVFYRNGATDIVYGLPTDTPVIGDWNGDHISEVGVYRDGVFYRNGATDIVYGLPTDTPVIGDWNGDHISEVGVFRDGVFYRKDATDIVYGLPTDTPIIGKWT